MAQGMNNAIFEFCMKHSDDPKNNAEGIPARPEEDYEWLRGALAEIKTDAERMESCLKIATDPSVTDLESKLIALEEILYFVEDLDNAADFCKTVKGSKLMLCLLSPDAPDTMREGAANIIGTCCQNNIISQGIVLADGGLPIIISQLVREEHQGARVKLIYALSSLIRGNRATMTSFFRHPDSVSSVVDVILKHPTDLKSAKKALFFLTCLWRDDAEMEGLPPIPASEELLAVLQTHLKNEGEDVQDLAVDFTIELVWMKKEKEKKKKLQTSGERG